MPKIQISDNMIKIGPIPLQRFLFLLSKHLSPHVMNVVNLITQKHLLFFRHHYLEFHSFFAWEFFNVFKVLSFHDSNFKPFAEQLLNHTWIRKLNENSIPLKLDFAELEKRDISLLEYQKRTIEKYSSYVPKLDLRGMVIAHEQGLGKTLTAISLMLVRKKERTLIICPKSLIPVWVNELKTKASESENLISTISTVHSSTKWLVVNYESISMIPKSFIQKSNVGLIVDESHFISHISSNRTQRIIDLVLNSHNSIDDVILLSGTPIKGDPLEWLPYLIILDPHIDRKIASLLIKSFFSTPNTIRHIANVRLQMYVMRATKSKNLSLPQKHIHTLPVKISKDIRIYLWSHIKEEIWNLLPKITKELKEKYLSDWQRISHLLEEKGAVKKDLEKFGKFLLSSTHENIGLDKDEAEKFTEKWLRLLDDTKDRFVLRKLKTAVSQFKSHIFGTVVNGLLAERRRQAVTDIVKSNINTFCKIIEDSKKKTIIVGDVIEALEEAYNSIQHHCNKSTILITGATNSTERKSKIDQFKTQLDPEVLVGSTKVIGVGFTLTVANTVIVLNMPFRFVDFLQVSDRVHRLSQDISVHVYICKLHTSELNIHEHMHLISLRTKELVESFLEHMSL